MNIAFNALSAKAGAGISVFQNLLPAIAKLDRSNSYFIFVSKKQKKIIDFIPENFNAIILKNVPDNPYLRVLFEQLVIPFYLWKYNIDILYSVGNTTILLAPCKILLFIENTNPFSKVIKKWTFKEKLRNRFLYFLGYLSSKKANRVRFCSKRSMEIIRKVYNIPEQKCFVLYHGLNFEKIDKIMNVSFDLEKNGYILSVSVVAPHKNFEVLIKAFAFLKNNNLYNGKLIIIGDTDCYREYYHSLLKLSEDLGIKDKITFLGKLPNEKVFLYYKNADLFIFPSLEETFGIPLIEALYCNSKVLCSDGSLYPELFIPFNEIGKELVTYFDPYQESDLVNKIVDILNSNSVNNSIEKTRKYLLKKFDVSNVANSLIKEFINLGVSS